VNIAFEHPAKVRRAVAMVAALLACTAGLVVASGHRADAQLGRANVIAFTRPVDGITQLFVVDPYQGVPTQVTTGAEPVSDPAWSPDGSLVVFVKQLSYGQALFYSYADGSSLTQVFFQPGRFDGVAWAPDGTRLAFGFDQGSGMHIWTTRLDGSHRVQITAGSATDKSPAWSPDGTHIAFVRTSGAGSRSHLFVMAPDGSGVTQVTHGRAADATPAWSPDGASLLFSSDRAGGRHLYAVAPDGSGLVQITQDAALDTDPMWSPYGDEAVFVRHAKGARAAQLMRLRRKDGLISPVTDGSAKDRSPAWQPPDAYDQWLDAAAKDAEQEALSAARQYWAMFGSYQGLSASWMQEIDPDGEYVDHGVLSTGSSVSVWGEGDAFFAARLSFTGVCFGLRDVDTTNTAYGAVPGMMCSADNARSNMILGPAWPPV
jgi:dipeptidyl aminopeptidase/acylaminoacyl peptidase